MEQRRWSPHGAPGPAPRAALAFVLLLGGCKVGPDYIPPQPDVPDAWRAAVTDGLTTGQSNIEEWWEVLGDPVLDELIQRAGQGNKDLKQSFARIKQARALRGIASGERFPDLEAAGGATRVETSDDFLLVQSSQDNPEDFYDLGVDATWEIDVWGRIRRSVEAADAGLDASVEDYRDLLVVLYAEVGTAYIEVRTLQARIAFNEANVERQRGTLQLTRDRFDAEIAAELDVRQAELNLATTESFVPQLREALARTVHRLGVLLGEYPGSLYETLGEPAPIPESPESVAVGVPIEVVRQRPDVRRTERELAAQTARVGVTTADLYPRFSLIGSFAFAGTSNLFDASNRTWDRGTFMRWNLFDGGRVRNRIRFEEFATEEALLRYEQTLLRALEEVESAIVAYCEETVRSEALARSVAAAERSVELVNSLYRTGLTDFQNVLDTERSLFQQQDVLAESQGKVVQNLVTLYRALGGGWQPDPAELADEVEDAKASGEPIF